MVSSLKDYDPEAHLSDGDIALDRFSDLSVVHLHIKASKVDPFCKGVSGKVGKDVCPVTAVLAVHRRDPGLFFRFHSGAHCRENSW